MSECTGPGCPHPEHTDPATMPAWQHQRLPTHAGDPYEPPMTLRRRA